jgi:hypothetical protein
VFGYASISTFEWEFLALSFCLPIL